MEEQESKDRIMGFTRNIEFEMLYFEVNNKVSGGLIFWFSDKLKIAHLAYLFTSEDNRNKGYGKIFLSESMQYMRDNFKINSFFIEIDSVKEINAIDLELRKRRQGFYGRLGYKKVDKFKYILPIGDIKKSPEMEIAFFNDNFKVISKDDLMKIIEEIYFGSYSKEKNNLRLQKISKMNKLKEYKFVDM